jgi:hypothetical protein
MKKKARLALLLLAGALFYLTAEKKVEAWGCEPQCWEVWNGSWCCTDANCIDYCF